VPTGFVAGFLNQVKSDLIFSSPNSFQRIAGMLQLSIFRPPCPTIAGLIRLLGATDLADSSFPTRIYSIIWGKNILRQTLRLDALRRAH